MRVYSRRAVLFITAALCGSAWLTVAGAGDVASSCSAEDGQCSAKNAPEAVRTAADVVLDNIDRLQESTARNVLKEGEAPEPENEDERVPERNGAKYVWNSAYQQWVAGEGTGRHEVKGLSPAAKKAIEELQKRKIAGSLAADGEKSRDKQNVSGADEMGDNELVALENAVMRLAKGTSENYLEDLDLVEYLCHSGDNGNHLEGIGGVEILLQLAKADGRGDVKVLSVKALATCAQNNPTVFNRALSDGAVGVLLELADSSENSAMRASALRALVSLREGASAHASFFEDQERLVRVIKRSVDVGIGGKDERRSVLRGLALIEPLLKKHSAQWLAPVENAGIVNWCREAISHDDVDVREAAALLVKVAGNGH